MSTRKTVLLVLIFLAVLVTGCAGTSPRTTAAPTPEEKFDAAIQDVIDAVIAAQSHTLAEVSPAAVMPTSLKTGTEFTRLEELVMERLTLELRKRHDVYALSRQNWFEFRENRPLSFFNLPLAERNHFRNLVIYEVGVSADEILDTARVHITASDADGRAVAGIVADTELDFTTDSPAGRLYGAKPKTRLYPEGLEERPYVSLDRLSFSLAAELADAYRTGITAGDQPVAGDEVRVMLYARTARNISAGLGQAIQDALQQSIVANRGFTCAVSEEDFGPAFHKIDFYRQNKSIFELEETKFSAGTVLLMADTAFHPDGDKIGIALRAIWRVSPLESEAGELIPTNVTGTYLSGFTAKSYLLSSAIKVRYPKPDATRLATSGDATQTATSAKVAGTETTESSGRQESAYIREMPARDTDVCFYKYTEVYEKRIYPVLSRAPGVLDIRRNQTLCEDGSRCLCYELGYQGTPESLEAYLRQNLRTSEVVPFRLVPKVEGRLEVYFHGGFE